MRLAIWSNAPFAPTGYGQQTAQLTKRLVADGHEVAVINNFGLGAAPMVINGVTIYPTSQTNPYSLDVANSYADHWFEGQRGLVIVLYDTWPLLGNPDFLKDHDAFYWAPIDHAPVPPQVLAFCSEHEVIAMSDFGTEQLTAAGAPPRYTIPHAIETGTFKPTPSDVRQQFDVPADAHLTVCVMANIGNSPVRKRWFENMMAWRLFAEQHDDAYLYLHTALRHPRGIDLASDLSIWGLPKDRLRVVDQSAYGSGMIGQDQLAGIYSAADVTLMATAGEGFGIPAVESQACGTPVIGTNFSAQKEVIGAGWKVSWTTDFDYGQGSGCALPDVNAIVSALEESYAMSPEQRADMSERAVGYAQRYDADTVYAEQWRPFLADRRPNREQRRRKNR